jgi:iron-sulfur cluster repair protein YtfE (RIC family)
MSTAHFLTETDLRQGEYRNLTRGINTAFLLEIKEDHAEFRTLLHRAEQRLRQHSAIKPRELADLLGRLRDEMETYFSLEEFYGGFELASHADASVARTVARLKQQHEQLYTALNDLVERAEQIAYHEVPANRLRGLVEDFWRFTGDLRRHEDAELDVISRQAAWDIGGGD